MRIPYKQRRTNLSLIFGVIWLVLFFAMFILSENFHWINYFWLIASITYFGIWFYQRKYEYVTIEDGILTVMGPLGKNIRLSEIKQITYFAGDYVIKGEKKKLKIYTEVISPDSVVKLKEELDIINKIDCD